MSQPLAGTFTNLGQKTKDKARRRPKPGPEWEEPLFCSKIQIGIAGSIALVQAHKAIMDIDPVSAAVSLYNGYLLIKGLHNYRITRQSADESPLRELLGDRAPANDNLLTSRQSMSNTCTLMSRTFACNAVGIFGFAGYDAATEGTPHPAALAFWAATAAFNGALSRLAGKQAEREGPPRMPSVTGKLPAL